jgi:CheY-like chemotaxis protein
MARILIVEDDKPSADAMALMLRHVGHRVAIAPSGHEALGSVMHETPDLVMLDLGIPGANGADVLEVLRSYLRLDSLPVVVWTGMADSDLAKRARELGASAVIEKGRETPAQILQTIDSALRDRPN